MKYQFEQLVANESSVDVAIFVEHCSHWMHYNYTQARNYKDGRYWTYNTKDSLLKFFPFWTYSQLNTILKNAIKTGFILTGNFNEKGYDRTMWYTLSDKALDHYPSIKGLEAPLRLISENSLMDKLILTNAKVKINRPIPGILPGSLPGNKNTGKAKTVAGNFLSSVEEKEKLVSLKNLHMRGDFKNDDEFLRACEHHIAKRQKKFPEKHLNQLLKGLRTLIIRKQFNKFTEKTNQIDKNQKTARQIAAEERAEHEKEKNLLEAKITREGAERGRNAMKDAIRRIG